VRGGDDSSNAGFVLRDGREADSRGKHAFVEQFRGELVRAGGFAHDHRRDRGFADAGVEAGIGQAFLEISRVGPELLDPLRLVPEDVEGGETGGGNGGWMRGRKKKRTRAMVEELNQVFRAADVAAQNPDGL